MNGRVLVEFLPEEAEGLLKRVSDESMSAAECDQAKAGADRLRQAIAIERGAGGSCSAKTSFHEQATALLGQLVTVYSSHGPKVGTLERISTSRVLVIRRGRLRSPVPLALVTEIKPHEALEEAA